MKKNILTKIFAINNIPLNDLQIQQFLLYYELLIKTNEKFNLTAITLFEEVAQKHFVDSVINYAHFAENSSLCDIGSGAGFPAIPLKIMRPDMSIVAVDSLNKRVDFINATINELKLNNIKAIHTRAQELQQILPRESFDYVTARAVAELRILSELCSPYVKINGEFIALKGNKVDGEIENCRHAISVLGLASPVVKDFQIKSLNNEKFPTQSRKILYLKKLKTTPLEYPRPKNKITQKPL